MSPKQLLSDLTKASVQRLTACIPGLSEGTAREVLLRAARDYATRPVAVEAGTRLIGQWQGGGSPSLLVDSVDDEGYLTITKGSTGTDFRSASVLPKPMRIHRDLLAPPPILDAARDDGRIGGRPATIETRGAQKDVGMSEVADMDREYATEDAAEALKSVLGRDVTADQATALRDEADAMLTELYADSPANGPGPVDFWVAGTAGKVAKSATLTDIQLPFATVKVRGQKPARINIWTRSAFREVLEP
ncbi:hypothetical protein [Mycolicibacterium fortuitum]|uniref:hypothetical protein n=1 Tax=Mycolicibacterium fortuitum TaxID=1766 RepID=UPI001CDD2F6E|nr:hypothetical protein [Mycolicibacterium fortuitum]UBV14894.1 hypothetical protein H8Z57_30115 [Mycolicibacterium fortuitum]